MWNDISPANSRRDGFPPDSLARLVRRVIRRRTGRGAVELAILATAKNVVDQLDSITFDDEASLASIVAARIQSALRCSPGRTIGDTSA